MIEKDCADGIGLAECWIPLRFRILISSYFDYYLIIYIGSLCPFSSCALVYASDWWLRLDETGARLKTVFLLAVIVVVHL